MYYIYIIKNKSGEIYTGVTHNLEKRLYYHNTRQGANFTKAHQGNFALAFKEEYNNLAEARQREIQIKKWSKDKKEVLIEKFTKGLPTKVKN